MKNTNTLFQSDIEKINSRHVRGTDKFHRMFAGIASNLERYENGIIYLRIENTEKNKPSSYITAVQFAGDWFNGNVELIDAKGFVVSFYKTISTGFAINGKDALSNKELVNNLVQQMKIADKEEKELINIFAGLFPNQLYTI